MSYPGHSLVEFYPSAEIQSVYSTAPVSCKIYYGSLLLLFHSWRVFHWRLSDSKFPQVSTTLLSILADFNAAVIWMISILLLITSSSNPIPSPLMSVPSALTTIGITVTLMFYVFFVFFSVLWQGPSILLFPLLWSTRLQVFFLYHYYYYYYYYFGSSLHQC